MKKRILLFGLVTLVLASLQVAEAQQPKKVPRIGWLGAGSNDENEEAFRQGLRELGYLEGQNIVIEWRAANEVRVGNQSKDCAADRSYDSAERAGESGQGDQVILNC
jgi:hypothetical protein